MNEPLLNDEEYGTTSADQVAVQPDEASAPPLWSGAQGDENTPDDENWEPGASAPPPYEEIKGYSVLPGVVKPDENVPNSWVGADPPPA